MWHFANIQVKTPNHNTCHSGIQGCVVCPVCPSGVAVLCCPIGVYAQPFIFGDTVVIGMPPGPPLTDKNRPLKKFTGAPAGESIARTLRMLELLFSWQATKLRQGQRCRITNSLQVHGKTLGGKKMHTVVWFVRVRFMAVFYARNSNGMLRSP